jgi:hypothetical protein
VKKKPTEHKWARLYRRVRSDQMTDARRLAEFDPVHEQAAVYRHSTFE